MIIREKPFEDLSSKEQEAFNLCSEILTWSSDRNIVMWPGIGRLREETTQLFEMVSNRPSSMDADRDDYYKVHADVNRLRKKYEEKRAYIKREISEKKFIRIGFDNESGDVGHLIEDIRRHMQGDIKHIEIFYITKFPPGVKPTGWGDYIEFHIWDH